jgi:WD40 repeat protein
MLWVGFTRDGTRAITSSLDGTVRFWDASTGREVAKVTRGGDLSAAALTPDGRRQIVAGFGDPSLSIVDTATNHLLLTVRGHNAPVSDVEVSPDGLLVASSSNDGTVRLWRSATAQDVASWEARPMVMAPGSR